MQRRSRRWPDAVALAAFVGLAMLLFRLSLFEGWTFVGDSDRLNSFLNVRLFEVESIQARGTVSAWNDQQFMGLGMTGLHWMLPGGSPIPYVMALFPLTQAFRLANIVTTSLLILACWCAYLALRTYSVLPLVAVAGGLLYGTSVYAIHRLAQVDASFSVLIVMPLLLVGIREARRETATWTFAWLTGCWAALMALTFLQEVAYAALFFGLYTLYRAARVRDPWVMAISGLAFACATMVGLPRLLTVAAEFRDLDRSMVDFTWTVAEAFRYFADGLVGRTNVEQELLRAPMLNLHEGVQLLSSPLAALGAIAAALLARSWVMRIWGVGLVVVLSVALVIWWRPVYDSLGRPSFPTRELRAALMNAVLIGLPLGLLCWRLAVRAYRPRIAESEVPVTPDTDAARLDGPFFAGFVVLALSTVYISEAHDALYELFLRVDFQHARISSVMLFPLVALVTMLLGRFLPTSLSSRGATWLVVGGLVGAVLWVGRELAVEALTAQIGPALEFLRPRRLLTIEGLRVASSCLVLVAAVVVLVGRTRVSVRTLTGALLAAWMVLEAGATADFKLNGPQAREQAIPFEALNYMTAPPGLLRVPSTDERAALRERLQADQYRVVVRQDPKQFPALLEPHLAAFWNLRLVEGYSSGLPRRLGSLPWPEGVTTPHHLDLNARQEPPWRLLAALNVKSVVTVSQSLWYNPAPGAAVPPLDLQRLEVRENPYPVMPRTFFTASVTPAATPPVLPGDNGDRPPAGDVPIEDLRQHSVAEGLTAARSFGTDGTIDATYAGDWIRVQMSPSTDDRFMVVNERYAEGWRATVDGAPAEIYPTNVVMRGVVVPAGASVVELRYVPFLFTGTGIGLLLGGVVVLVLVGVGIRRAAARGRRATSADAAETGQSGETGPSPAEALTAERPRAPAP
ncbi:MAG: hypothetical protein U0893_05405 [Chloroflexota bacterium]